MLLQAVDREQHGQSLVASAQANLQLLAAMAGAGAKPSSLMALHNEALRLMAVGHDLLQQHGPASIKTALNEAGTPKLEEMAAILKALKATNAKDMLPLD